MNISHKRRKQSGFFDLGLGLGLMMVFGGAAAVLDDDKTEQQSMAEPETEISQPKVVVVKSDSQ